MNGQLPSLPTGGKKTFLLISWLPIDRTLLDALRPFKARARGRRIKELACLGAVVEKIGFRIEAVDGEYRLLAPAGPGLLVAPAIAESVLAALPIARTESPQIAGTVGIATAAELAPVESEHPDALEFASNYPLISVAK